MGFSTGILAVCSFKHLWEKKTAFSYWFFCCWGLRLLEQPQLGCRMSPNVSGLFPPRTGLRLRKVSPMLPVPQPGSPAGW